MDSNTDARRTVSLITMLVLMPIIAQATELPVGDGKVSISAKTGYVFSCNQNFRGGGARHVGDWFKGDVWDPTQKPHVQGKVMWPDAEFSITENEQSLVVAGNNLPVGQPTGSFPIAKTDPAYQFDTNPNPIASIKMKFSIPHRPEIANAPGCLSMGMIGFTVTGVAFYNALDDAGRDAAAHEVQDLCDGHPQGKGQYHYHSTSPCLPGANTNNLVGWALDGYPIFGMKDATGKQFENSDLDACHGRKEDITIEGRSYDYAYRITAEYPYVMGCFTGKVLTETSQSIKASMGPPKQRGPKFDQKSQNGAPRGTNNNKPRQSAQNQNNTGQQRQMPQEAINACVSRSQGSNCSFNGRGGNQVRGVCGTPPKMKSGQTVCMPQRGN